MVRKEARSFFLAGGDEEDLIQEGMIGLFKAVTSYQEEKNTSFSTFAYLCVQRQIITTITAFNRKKQIPLNTAISLFEQKNQEEELSLDEILETPEETPEEMMLRKEELNGRLYDNARAHPHEADGVHDPHGRGSQEKDLRGGRKRVFLPRYSQGNG